MSVAKFCAIFGFFILSVAFSAGEICQSPDVSSSFYSTSDSQLASESVLIVEFSLKCANGAKDINLHAEVNGKTLPVTKTVDTDKYQVSISDEHKKLPKGLYKIRIFDDEQYSELRKVQRTGDDAASATSLHTFEVHHQGVSRGPWIQTEHLAAAGVALVCYLAYNARSQLQS